jgi:hypothetical protein
MNDKKAGCSKNKKNSSTETAVWAEIRKKGKLHTNAMKTL